MGAVKRRSHENQTFRSELHSNSGANLSGDLAGGASKALGIVMLIGFIFGTICVVGGGFAIRRGDTDAGKLSIIGGLIIAGAPVIVKALFTAFGIDSSTVDVGAFQ